MLYHWAIRTSYSNPLQILHITIHPIPTLHAILTSRIFHFLNWLRQNLIKTKINIIKKSFSPFWIVLFVICASDRLSWEFGTGPWTLMGFARFNAYFWNAMTFTVLKLTTLRVSLFSWTSDFLSAAMERSPRFLAFIPLRSATWQMTFCGSIAWTE